MGGYRKSEQRNRTYTVEVPFRNEEYNQTYSYAAMWTDHTSDRSRDNVATCSQGVVYCLQTGKRRMLCSKGGTRKSKLTAPKKTIFQSGIPRRNSVP